MNRDLLEQDLIRDEDDRAFPYDDATGLPLKPGDTLKGNLTGATGRNLTGRGLRPDERALMRRNDMLEVQDELDRHAIWWRDMPEPAQRGLANMCFNMGWPRLSGFVQMLAALKDGHYELAAHEALASAWAKQVGDKAPDKDHPLGQRAWRIAQLFLSCAH